MEMFGRPERNSNANRYLDVTYGILPWIFDAEMEKIEVTPAVVVSLRPSKFDSCQFDSAGVASNTIPRKRPKSWKHAKQCRDAVIGFHAAQHWWRGWRSKSWLTVGLVSLRKEDINTN